MRKSSRQRRPDPALSRIRSWAWAGATAGAAFVGGLLLADAHSVASLIAAERTATGIAAAVSLLLLLGALFGVLGMALGFATRQPPAGPSPTPLEALRFSPKLVPQRASSRPGRDRRRYP